MYTSFLTPMQDVVGKVDMLPALLFGILNLAADPLGREAPNGALLFICRVIG